MTWQPSLHQIFKYLVILKMIRLILTYDFVSNKMFPLILTKLLKINQNQTKMIRLIVPLLQTRPFQEKHKQITLLKLNLECANA